MYFMGWRTANALPLNLLTYILCFFCRATMRLCSLPLCFEDCFHQIFLALLHVQRFKRLNLDDFTGQSQRPYWSRELLWIMDLYYANLCGLMKMKRIEDDDIVSRLSPIWSAISEVKMPWPDLLFFHLWFSAKYCNQESLVGTETSAILHSLFTLGDGWASDSVSETQPSMLFLELILNASRITNLLCMFWI